jgi:hypothetical protein
MLYCQGGQLNNIGRILRQSQMDVGIGGEKNYTFNNAHLLLNAK